MKRLLTFPLILAAAVLCAVIAAWSRDLADELEDELRQ